ncbi:MAG TPA: hypothetical protein VEY10_00945 [Flavisolibacter sp.]|jgi:hypothetical protein|nr:hypothetical protein [Flavisolibacter sp.]
MRFLLATLLTAALSFIAGLYTPWWSIAVVSFLVALLVKQRFGIAFFSGFLGIFLLWGGLSLWIDTANNQVLSHKIALIFPLGGSSVLLIVVTALVGALVGGFAAMSGSALRPAERRAVVK